MKKKTITGATALGLIVSTTPVYAIPTDEGGLVNENVKTLSNPNSPAEQTIGQEVVYTGFTQGAETSSGNGSIDNPYNLFKDAVENVADGGTIYIKGDTYAFLNDSNDGLPFVIDKNVTIKAVEGEENAALEVRSAGIVLGANVKFENITLNFANKHHDSIFANGYTLDLINVKRYSGARDIDLFAGGLYVNGSNVQPSGSNGVINIVANEGLSDFGNIYAGSMNGEFNGNAEINVSSEKAGNTLNIGAIKASGALEADTGGMLDTTEPLPPEANPTLFPMNGQVSINLDNYQVEVDGTTGGNGVTNVTTSTVYPTDLKLTNIDSLTIEEGHISVVSEETDVKAISNVTVGSGAVLDLSKAGNEFAISNYNGNGIVMLAKDGRLDITNTVEGSIELQTEGAFGGKSGEVNENHTYITAPTNAVISFTPHTSQSYLDLVAKQTETGFEWVTEESTESEELVEITGFNITEDTKTVTVDEINSESTSFQFEIETGRELTDDDFINLADYDFEITVNGKQAVQENGEYVVDGLSMYFTTETMAYDHELVVVGADAEAGRYKIKVAHNGAEFTTTLNVADENGNIPEGDSTEAETPANEWLTFDSISDLDGKWTFDNSDENKIVLKEYLHGEKNPKVEIPAILDGKRVEIQNFATDSYENVTHIRLGETNGVKPIMAAGDTLNQSLKGHQTLQYLDLSGLDISGVTRLYVTFSEMPNLEYMNLSGWNQKEIPYSNSSFIKNPKLKTVDLSGLTLAGHTYNHANFNECPEITEVIIRDMPNKTYFDRAKNIVLASGSIQEGTVTLDLTGLQLTEADTSLESWFWSGKIINIIGLETLDVSKVTNMKNMFKYSGVANIEGLKDWDTSSVTDMGEMFANATNITDFSPLKDWNVSNVTLMNGLFLNTNAETLDLSGWNTSSVTNMNGLFKNMTNLNSITFGENWDTERVTTMYETFYGLDSLNFLDLSEWSIKNGTNIGNWFKLNSNEFGKQLLVVTDSARLQQYDYEGSNRVPASITLNSDGEEFAKGQERFYVTSDEFNRIDEIIENEIESLGVPTKEGYNFVEWQATETAESAFDKLNMTYTAVWKSADEEIEILEPVFLSDIGYVANQSSAQHESIKKDKNPANGVITLVVDGQAQQFTKGYGAHANSTLVFDLTNYTDRYNKLTARMGVDSSKGSNGNGVKFFVYTSMDGVKWYKVDETPAVKGDEESLVLDLNVEGINFVKLVANNNGNDSYDHAVYGDLKLVKENVVETPETTVVEGLQMLEYFDAILADNTVEENMQNNKKAIMQRSIVEKFTYGNLLRKASQSETNKEAIEFLLNDENALNYFVNGGEINVDGNYGNVLDAWIEIYNQHGSELTNPADNNFNLRLATSISLAFAQPILNRFWMLSDKPVSASLRYETYQELVESGKMDEGGDTTGYGKWTTQQFKELPIAMMRWTVDNRINDDEVMWLADHALSHKERGNEYLNAYNYIAYTTGYNYDNAKLYDETNKDYFNEKYSNFTNYFNDYGTRGIYRLWMIFEEGSVCGGLAKTYSNLADTFGRPSSVVGQPGHAATMTWGWHTTNQRYEWMLQNDIYGWAESGNEYSDRMLGWGNKSWTIWYNASYNVLATDAVLNETDFENANLINELAKVYNSNEDKKQAYEKALTHQAINVDSIEGLINAYKADDSTTNAQWLDLAKRVINALTYYPQVMMELLVLIEAEMGTGAETVQLDILKNNALLSASNATPEVSTNVQMSKQLANKYLGNVSSEVATFSFDGENAGKIVMNPAYEGSQITVEYSLDGGTTWTETDQHVIELTDEELASITAENDVKVSLVGTDAVYTIDITAGTAITNTNVYANDFENLLLGNLENLEFSIDGGNEWCDYVSGDDNGINQNNVSGIRFDGDQTVKVRYKAHGTQLQSATVTYNFTENVEEDTRKYVQLKNVKFVESSAHQGGHNPEQMIDGKFEQGYHSPYGSFTDDKFYTVEFDKPRYISSMEYVFAGGNNGRMKAGTIQASMDGVNWTTIKTFADMPRDRQVTVYDMDAVIEAKFIKLVPTETHGNSSGENNKFFSGKELRFFEDTTKVEVEEETPDTPQEPETPEIPEDNNPTEPQPPVDEPIEPELPEEDGGNDSEGDDDSEGDNPDEELPPAEDEEEEDLTFADKVVEIVTNAVDTIEEKIQKFKELLTDEGETNVDDTSDEIYEETINEINNDIESGEDKYSTLEAIKELICFIKETFSGVTLPDDAPVDTDDIPTILPDDVPVDTDDIPTTLPDDVPVEEDKTETPDVEEEVNPQPTPPTNGGGGSVGGGGSTVQPPSTENTPTNGIENLKDLDTQLQEKVDSLIAEVAKDKQGLSLNILGDEEDIKNVNQVEVTKDGVFAIVNGEKLKFGVELDAEGLDLTKSRVVRVEKARNSIMRYSAIPHKNTKDGVKISTSDLENILITSKVAEPFADVADNHWFKSNVEEMYNYGFTTGTSATTYDPYASITRGEFATMIARALELKSDNKTKFVDVNGKWYAKEVQALFEAGIIKGNVDGTFGGENNITRQEAATIIARMLTYAGVDVTVDKTVKFADADKIGTYAKESIQYLASQGVLEGGGDGKFNPTNNLTRAEMAKILVQSLRLTDLY